MTRDYFQQAPSDALAFVRLHGLDLLGDKAEDVLADLYYEAGWLGWATSLALIADARERHKDINITSRVDWGGWTPGNPTVAKKLLGTAKVPGLNDLLAKRQVTISGIKETRYKDLAKILARGAEQGSSMDAVAKEISEYMTMDEAWSYLVAKTETRAAATAAALDSYREASITMKEWLVAWDEACELCQSAEDMGPVPLDEDFGDAGGGPPAHPACLCVVLPVVGDAETGPFATEGEIMELSPVGHILKAGRNAIDRALLALDAVPLVDQKHIAVPWPIVKRPELDPHLWRESRVETVPIVDLCATQPLLNRERVEFYVRNPGAIEQGRRAFANVYDSGGTLAIVDGHHRLAALWLLGAEDALAWMLREAQ